MTLKNGNLIQTLLLIVILFLCACSDSPNTSLKMAEQGVVTSAISSNGALAVVVSVNHDTAVWNLDEKKYLYSLRHKNTEQANIIAADFNNDGTLLLTAERNNIILWNTQTGKTLVNYDLPSEIQAIALSSSGQKALIGLLNAKALLVDLNTGNLLNSFQHTETINTVALSANGQYALTGSDDHFAVLWEIKKNKVVHKLRHKKRVMIVGFSPDSQQILTSCLLDKVKLWDVKTGLLNYDLGIRLRSISSYKFSNDSTKLALGIFPQRLELWQLQKNSAFIENTWNIAKPSFWRPSATLINSLAFDEQNKAIISQDSRGYASWW